MPIALLDMDDRKNPMVVGTIASAHVALLGGGAIGLAAALVSRLFGAGDIRIGEPYPLRRAATAEGDAFTVYEPGAMGQAP